MAREGNGAWDAACIVMEVNTGNVLAMASYPFFDLNDTRNPEPLIGSRMIDVSGNSTDTVITEEIAAAMEEDNDLLLQNLNAPLEKLLHQQHLRARIHDEALRGCHGAGGTDG